MIRLFSVLVALLVAIGVTASVNRARAVATGDSSNLAVGRALSAADGISVVRIVGGLLVMASRAQPFDILGWSFWIGWLLSFAAGEWWIRRSRARGLAIA